MLESGGVDSADISRPLELSTDVQLIQRTLLTPHGGLY